MSSECSVSSINSKAELAELLKNGLELGELCECVAEHVGNPVAMTLPSRAVLACSSNYGHSLEPDPIRAFLISLLDGAADNGSGWLRMQGAIFKAAKSFCLAWLVPPSGSGEEFEQRLLGFCAEQKSWWCVQSGGGFVILLDAAETERIPALAEVFAGQRICISDEFRSLRDTAAQLELARMALKFSYTDLRRDNLIAVDDYKPLIAYFYARSNSNLDIFTNNLLERIKKYDAKCGTAYLETLRVCIHCNQDPGLIAQTLNIHKNTVFYRLRQLRELFNVDLKSMRQVANLYFSLCLEYHR